MHTTRLSTAAKIAVGCLSLLGFAGAWLIVIDAGFHHMPSRRSHETIVVDGPAAVAMAVIMLFLAATALTALLQTWTKSRWVYAISFGLAFLPPMAYLASA
jgi:hypothetical protein